MNRLQCAIIHLRLNVIIDFMCFTPYIYLIFHCQQLINYGRFKCMVASASEVLIIIAGNFLFNL